MLRASKYKLSTKDNGVLDSEVGILDDELRTIQKTNTMTAEDVITKESEGVFITWGIVVLQVQRKLAQLCNMNFKDR